MAFPKNLTGAGAPINGTNAVQTLTTSGSPSTGAIYLKLRGRVFGPLTPSTTDSDLQGALDAAFGSSQVVVTGSDLAGGLTLTYSGLTMSRQPQALPTIDTSTWDTGTILIASSVTGVAPTGGRGLPIGSTYIDTATGLIYENISTTVNPRWVLATDGTVPVIARTADITLTEVQSGSIVTNTGASGTVTATLPAAVVGLSFTFSLGAAQQLRIDPSSSETIGLPSTGVPGAAGKYLVADAVGETVHLVCAVAGNWAVAGFTGTWTAEP